MKTLQINRLKFPLVILMFAGIAFVGCSSDRIAGPDKTVAENLAEMAVMDTIDFALAKKGNSGPPAYQYPMSNAQKFTYIRGLNTYKGGTLKINAIQGSFLQVENKSLTPPTDIPWGEPVTITMQVDYDSTANEMIFTFGPHGCQFSPAAMIRLDYRALGVERPQLYYIEDDGSRTLQQPDHINTTQRFMIIYVDHFSRYALVHA